MEPGQRLGQQPRAQGRGGAEPHPSPAKPGQLGDLAAGRVRVGEHAAGEGEQRLAGGREGHVAPGAAEQRRAQLGLQGLDLLAQRRLGDPHPLRRVREVGGLGHSDERGELL